jgi:hypothetical protein
MRDRAGHGDRKMKKGFEILAILTFVILSAGAAAAQKGMAGKPTITIRTENFPRPPYSGATYYIYEQDDEVICTKLEVCNKFGVCSTVYRKGRFKEEEDLQTGEPYGTTPRVLIANRKLKNHRWLTKFGLLPK